MKIINLVCAFSLFATVVAANAQDTNQKGNTSPSYADPSKLTAKAPDTFQAQFDTTKGKFTVEVTRSLAPGGADRF
ncbi:MAG TPA: hypothetical protein VFY06_03145, partial [Verrucomicrobiae bacterium]|nr:hypothetical protein [Verrucomicrobiae bacterium]